MYLALLSKLNVYSLSLNVPLSTIRQAYLIFNYSLFSSFSCLSRPNELKTLLKLLFTSMLATLRAIHV